ncbi:MAG: hypothetical protein PHS19_05580 [Eubacteriales bacterium]|nr:hypothetical protein [Eubacteriales bacterium]
MGGDIIGKFIYFWAFIIGVIIFGRIFGFMNDTKTAIIVLIASSIVYLVWVIGRSKAAQRREERENENRKNTIKVKGQGNKRR